MQYFKEEEFNGWYDQLHPELKIALDKLRELIKRPIFISQAEGAVGRKDDSNSYHNINKHGYVMAVDIFPTYVKTKDDCTFIYDKAVEAGFKGIGLYPFWRQGIGFHVDIRKRDRVSRWSLIKGGYVSWLSGLNEIGDDT